MTNKGLSKLIEECGEVIQVAGKMLACPTGEHWDGGPPLYLRLTDEAADLTAALAFVASKHGFDAARFEQRVNMKLKLFREWDADPNA